MAVQERKPSIFAHRGASAYAPENTLAAFELAIQQRADLVEFDTRLTQDRRVVVIHDHTVNRTTDGSGRVSDFPYNELRKFNASNKFREQYPRESIPLLEEVIEACKGRIKFNIELSNYLTPFDQLETKVARVIHHYQLHQDVLVSSFHPIPLRRFHTLCPEIPIGFLARKGLKGYLSRGWLGRALVPYNALHPDKSDVTPGLLNKASSLGLLIHTFTVNDVGEMQNLIALGVDGLITDDPFSARSLLDKNHP